jgi:hypothetical protein
MDQLVKGRDSGLQRKEKMLLFKTAGDPAMVSTFNRPLTEGSLDRAGHPCQSSCGFIFKVNPFLP